MAQQVKRAFKDRFHPTDEQAAELSRTFGRGRGRPARAQRELSRKAEGSANREKARRRVAKVHARIAGRRRDFLHKLSTRLVRENPTVVIEDLTVRNLLENGRLARASSKLCGTCGTAHDRDVNAARTILAAGPAASACGDGVRPQRESSRTGQSSAKQETQRATAGIPRPWRGRKSTGQCWARDGRSQGARTIFGGVRTETPPSLGT